MIMVTIDGKTSGLISIVQTYYLYDNYRFHGSNYQKP